MVSVTCTKTHTWAAGLVFTHYMALLIMNYMTGVKITKLSCKKANTAP